MLDLFARVLFTSGLVARVRELRKPPAHNENLPRPGLVVQPFAVTDTNGVAFTEADLDGPVRVGFFSVGCGPCRLLSDALLADPPATPFVSIVDGDLADQDTTARLDEKVGALVRSVVLLASFTGALLVVWPPMTLLLLASVITAVVARLATARREAATEEAWVATVPARGWRRGAGERWCRARSPCSVRQWAGQALSWWR